MEEAPESIGWGCLSASTMPHNIEAFGLKRKPGASGYSAPKSRTLHQFRALRAIGCQNHDIMAAVAGVGVARDRAGGRLG
jgi:hypothetical protein